MVIAGYSRSRKCEPLGARESRKLSPAGLKPRAGTRLERISGVLTFQPYGVIMKLSLGDE